MEFAVEVRNFSLSINSKFVLRNIALQAEAGAITGVIGASGSGKSTLFRSILNLPISSGSKISGDILVFGKNNFKAERRLVQPVFQDPVSFFNPAFTLGKAMSEPLEINFHLNKAQREERIREILTEFGMPEINLQKNIMSFSGGELQRLSIIRAFLCEPEVLLMDEPVSALDPLIQRDVVNFLMETYRKKKISILIISHDIQLILFLCDHIYVLKDGEIIDSVSSGRIDDENVTEYTKSIFKSRNYSRKNFTGEAN